MLARANAGVFWPLSRRQASMAAPSAQVNCGCGATASGWPSAALSAASMPGTIATPPVSTIGGVDVPAGHGRHARGQRRLHAGHDVLRQ